MKVPLSWLKDYVDITVPPEDLAYTLTMAGLEVEAIEYIGADWGDKIITSQIVHLEKVPGSDHLTCTCDHGQGRTRRRIRNHLWRTQYSTGRQSAPRTRRSQNR